MYRSTLFLFFILLFVSCQQDFNVQEESQQLEGDIPSELAPYFLSFKEEASARGLAINYETANVTAEISEIDQGSVAGTCTTNGHTIRHIRIDQGFWDRAPQLQREMVIYHELGHCILGRGHTEGSFDSGICRSIMRSGLGSCRDAYTAENRSYFVEELFDTSN